MLVFSRREGDQIEIAEGIRITVLHIAGNRVRLGVSAPGVFAVRRGELDEAVRGKGEPAEDDTPPLTDVDTVERAGD